ncbi:MAG: hypothetical protein Kow0040_16960 [Thermogutta sp.]
MTFSERDGGEGSAPADRAESATPPQTIAKTTIANRKRMSGMARFLEKETTALTRRVAEADQTRKALRLFRERVVTMPTTSRKRFPE